MFTLLVAFEPNQSMASLPRCIGIGLHAWNLFEQAKVVMVVEIFVVIMKSRILIVDAKWVLVHKNFHIGSVQNSA